MPLYPPFLQTPIVLSALNVAMGTAGANTDQATIVVPAWITRYRVMGGAATSDPALTLIARTFTATMAGGTLTINTAAAGAGTYLTADANGPSTAAAPSGSVASNNAFATASTLYVRQILNSANAGTVDVYVKIWPML